MTADRARPRLPRTLAPLLTDRVGALIRGPGWRRVVMLRRIAAVVLVLAALVLALRPGAGDAGAAPVLVAARDLSSGSTVSPTDVVVRQWPSELVPTAALHDHGQLHGRPLAGAVRAGEPITDLRMAGPELARMATGSADTATVPIRLADADIAALLHPGVTVDVVGAAEHTQTPVLLAAGAVVLTVLPPDNEPGRRGRLVLVALPRSVASSVAGAALAQQVTITLG